MEEQHPELCRIVVVDDNQDAADMLADLLGAQGFPVRTAYNGTDALQVLREFHPRIGILDIGLPDILGYDVAREARRELHEEVLLVAVTGWGAEKDVERAFDAGFDFHVTKPADPDDLLALIQERCWDVHGALRSGRVRGSGRSWPMGQALPPGDDDEYVDVYWYQYWDADLERMTVSKWMATRESIGERGEPIRESARRVHRSELDGFGRLIVTERKMH